LHPRKPSEGKLSCKSRVSCLLHGLLDNVRAYPVCGRIYACHNESKRRNFVRLQPVCTFHGGCRYDLLSGILLSKKRLYVIGDGILKLVKIAGGIKGVLNYAPVLNIEGERPRLLSGAN
jgi:hypothetical protein